MDLFNSLILFGAGIVGGIISSLAGGASLFTFPALLATGLTPTVAVAVNRGADAEPVSGRVLRSRAAAGAATGRSSCSIIASIVGGLIGAVLLLLTPERCLPRWCRCCSPSRPCCSRSRRGSAPGWRRAFGSRAGEPSAVHSAVVMLPVAIYGGYFGAGLGVLVLGCCRSARAATIAPPTRPRIW